jgi:hypothetical protein
MADVAERPPYPRQIETGRGNIAWPPQGHDAVLPLNKTHKLLNINNLCDIIEFIGRVGMGIVGKGDWGLFLGRFWVSSPAVLAPWTPPPPPP